MQTVSLLCIFRVLTFIFNIGFTEEVRQFGTVIGIDLGTTYSCVAVFKNCHVEIIDNDQGHRITPSYVGFTPNNERLVGDAAKNLLTTNPRNTIFQVKRLIGRKFDDPTVQQDIKHFPFTVIDKNNRPIIKVSTDYGDKLFTPEEISAMILSKMRVIAEEYLGEEVKHAVITVPAYFNDAQRKATKDAGTIAGLNVIRIINEPTAAAIAFGLNKLNSKEGAQNVLVYDLGGGTFDVSLLTLDNGAFEVLATNGDTHLGGEDFDQRVMSYFLQLFKKKTGKDAGKNPRAIQKLRREVERAKRILSSEHQTKIEIESFLPNEDFSEILTRAKFEELNIDLFRSTLKPVEIVLKDGKVDKSNIAEVILVGGSTRIPKIQDILTQFFGKKPGRGVNPDEAVANGAAIQAAILGGEECTPDIVVLDINPLSLGIETVGKVMSTIIPRNSQIPITEKQMFSTTTDDQTVVAIQIFEGERPNTTDNHFLGQFDLTGIPSAPRGVPEIFVTFDIDVNGILNVTAEEKTQGSKKNIIIDSKTNRLTTKEIDRMVKQAEKFSEQDKIVRDRVNAKNDLESEVYSLRNELADRNTQFGRLDLQERATIEIQIEKQIEWIESHPFASVNELIQQKSHFKEIVSGIIDEINRRTDSGLNITQTRSRRSEL
ncbi:hypothetical protein I4U23_015139 [Adineta vaga]|nr:hypothetical protein I4U23_015139 [Adineta vaga]